MSEVELIIVGVLVAVAGLGALASRISVPYPIVLVIGGAVFGFVPGVPDIVLEPDVVLVIFLPPLLYKAAIFANVGDFRVTIRSLTLSALVLVLATASAVAYVAHAVIPDLPWAAAFALGAIVSPTDPVAATTVMRRLGVPRQLVSAIEGEGLFNDATALVVYRVAVGAAVTGAFSLWHATLQFVLAASGGVAIGFVVGWLVCRVRMRVADAQVSIVMSLLTGYAAYIPAETVHASGVLAAVAAGLYMGIRAPELLPSSLARLQGGFVWDIVDFVVNAVLFVLVGLQLHAVVSGLTGESPLAVCGYAFAVTAVVVGVRLAWLFSVPYLIRVLDRRPSQQARRVGAAERLVIGWSGMRGAVSLAVALALPLQTDDGAPFPSRDLLIVLTFAVIFFTLVIQGLTLPAMIRRFDISDDGADANDDARVRLIATKAALEEIDRLADEPWPNDDTIERMRGLYEFRKSRFAVRAGKREDDGLEDRSVAYQRVVRAVLHAQRTAIVHARNRGDVSNEAMNRVMRDLDLEEVRLDA